MKIEIADINTIKPYENNPRKLSELAIEKVAMSLKEYGFRQPIVVDKNNIIVAGHTRYRASKKLGYKQVPITIVDNLTPEQINAYRIADNRTAEESDWDNDLLKMEIKELELKDFNLDLLGFNEDQLNEILFEEKQGLTDEDAVPEAPEEPITKLGDIWKLGNHRVMCGDSTSIDIVEKLMENQKADMVFTDPPYGVNYDGGHAVKNTRREKLLNDATPEIYASVMPVIYSISKDGAATYLWYSDSKSASVIDAVTSAGYKIRNTLIWNKNVAQFGAINAQYKSKHEPCLYCFKKGFAPYWSGVNNEVSVWDIKRSRKNEFHPTQKPVELAERAMNNSSKQGDYILDLFGGSGSTLIACEKIGRINRSMELDPKYCDVIVKRWEQFTGKKAELENGQN